ncbi:hypothetical protein GH714_009344 [Hevea brasiliensis]|uniref:C2H2-type domain-containing protein n=1 Tax=Hevea brasiliensis TaxID=3981 RepID=A0A6A6K490_HEVBR|nr:hypothetical protein GH714_009344 [Hevea brasiliensis]
MEMSMEDSCSHTVMLSMARVSLSVAVRTRRSQPNSPIQTPIRISFSQKTKIEFANLSLGQFEGVKCATQLNLRIFCEKFLDGGEWELGLPKMGSSSLKEQLARTTLHNVRSKGHPYVELREDGKRFIFFCTLCLAPCYSDSVLFDHLKGNLHTERLSAAKLTLLKPNPWPFSDGVHFFINSIENERQLAITSGNHSRLLESNSNSDNLAIVKYDANLRSTGNGHVGYNKDLNGNGVTFHLVIPGVLVKDEISDLKARFVGSGQIAARFCEKDGNICEISRIWCEWLGENNPVDEDKVKVLDHEFAVLTFAYNYDLGRKGCLMM